MPDRIDVYVRFIDLPVDATEERIGGLEDVNLDRDTAGAAVGVELLDVLGVEINGRAVAAPGDVRPWFTDLRAMARAWRSDGWRACGLELDAYLDKLEDQGAHRA